MKSTFKRISKKPTTLGAAHDNSNMISKSSSTNEISSEASIPRKATEEIAVKSHRLERIDVNLNVEDRFCQQLLGWSLQIDSSSTSLPPRLLSSYESYEQYVNYWEPYILEEIKASTLSSLSSKQSRDFNHGTLTLPNFTSIESSSKIRILKYTTDFSPNSTAAESSIRQPLIKLSSCDLVLLTYDIITSPITTNKIMNRPSSSFILGYISSTRKYEFQLKVLNSSWKQFTTFTIEHNKSKMLSDPSVLVSDANVSIANSCIQFIVIDSLTSNYREYDAIFSLHKSPFVNFIINKPNHDRTPVSPPYSPSNVDERGGPITGIGELLYPILENRYNSSQLSAIRISAEKNDGIMLIQGPPGTGKTTTIMGIMNTLHVKYFNRSYESAIAAVMGTEGIKCRYASKEDYTPWINLSLLMKRPRLLVLAPSNIAVDNLVERILDQGFIDGNGNQYWPSMLRLGSGSRRSKVRVISLEETTESILGVGRDELLILRETVSTTVGQLVREIFGTQTLLLTMRDAWHRHELPFGVELRVDPATSAPYWVDHRSRSSSTLPPSPPTLSSDRSAYSLETLPEYTIYSSRLAPLLDQLRHQSLQLRRLVLRDQMADRHQHYRTLVETSLIEDAHIVFTTLNSSGHSSLDSSSFDDIVVDEAAQCIEPSLLIALRLQSNRCLLVGDPMQLPATIFSNKVKGSGFDQSLFERLMNSGHDVTLLKTQYRMLPAISAFPNKMFYGGRLENGSNVQDSRSCPPYINLTSSQLKEKDDITFLPFVFFDLKTSRDEMTSSQSRSNLAEADFCINFLKLFISKCATKGHMPSSIGIITPYQEQLSELKRLISDVNWSSILSINTRVFLKMSDIELNTVDSFQGREKDVILISCVRANDDGAIGFLSDVRRMNVALTRAKFGLYIVGHAETLRSNSMWSRLIAHAEDSCSFLEVGSHTDNVENGIRRLGFAPEVSLLVSEVTSVPVVAPKSKLLGRLAKKRKNNDAEEDGEAREADVIRVAV